ncbi:synaptobrevin [Rhizodiscina lignyota]|uniref:Protein transport protein BOS1 n=1 Tax=Rhizodiscina lignyota TaxID=1504668 RepID=A0A9P4M887_9PEZI|nr:synaptobrevin [Rhizodiscina lignyota]
MNNLFNSALRQSTSLRKDLDTLSSTPSPSPALQGQISTSLTSFSRTIDEYANLASQELHPDKKSKALERTKTFRSELADYRERFAQVKKSLEEQQTTVNKAELLGRRPHHAATPENPYANVTTSNGPWKPPPGGSGGAIFGSNDATRESHALREQSFMQQTNSQLDEFLERGRAVLGDLGEQREMLKGTQRKLYSVANTLGISGDTIRMVERRAMQDKWIFWGGVVVFVGFCWLVLHYLR